MAIEKRTLPNGDVVGFDTVKNSYCNLPKDYTEETTYDNLPFSDVAEEERPPFPSLEELQTAKRRGRPKKVT